MRKFIMALLAIAVLAGCGKTVIVTKDDAAEICLDAVGYSVEEVRNLDVKEKNGFTVKFDSNTKKYVFNVNEEGIIETRTVEALPKSEVISSEKKQESDSGISKEIEEKAVNNALSNFGVSRENMKEYTIEINPEKEDTLRIQIILNDGRSFTTIATLEGVPVSSYAS